jgi:CBS domain-containing protein
MLEMAHGPSCMLVKAIMTRSVITTEAAHSIESAAHLMREGRFRHLPVVHHGHMVGIISDRDIVDRQLR